MKDEMLLEVIKDYKKILEIVSSRLEKLEALAHEQGHNTNIGAYVKDEISQRQGQLSEEINRVRQQAMEQVKASMASMSNIPNMTQMPAMGAMPNMTGNMPNMDINKIKANIMQEMKSKKETDDNG